MKKPFFSIITPVYNSEKYLFSLFETLKNQTFADFELILINDNSTDQSLKIMQEFKDFPITVITNDKNSGPGFSRNSGINNANGQWLMFVDADDELKSDRLQIFYENIIKNPDIRFFADYTSFCVDSVDSLTPYMIKGDKKRRTFSASGFVRKRYVFHPVISSEIQKHLDIRFLIDSRYGEDFYFYLKALNHFKSGCLIPYSGYLYRLAEGSLTTQSGRYEQFQEVLNQLINDHKIDLNTRKALIKRKIINNKELRFTSFITKIKNRLWNWKTFIDFVVLLPFILEKILVKLLYLAQLGKNRSDRRTSYHSNC